MLQVEEVRATLPLVEGGSLKDIFSNAGKEKNFHRACLGASASRPALAVFSSPDLYLLLPGFFNQMMQVGRR